MYRFGIIGELFQMAVRRKKWFLIPPIAMIVLVAALIIAAQATPLGPLIYPIF